MSTEDSPELYPQDSPEFYPDEYFVGFDGAKLAGDGYRTLALAHRNADGTVHVTTVDAFVGPDGEELYASHGWRLRGWDALTLRIWSEGRRLAAEFDRLEDHWAPWIAGLPVDGPFDWMSWPWEMMRVWQLPPDPINDRSRWTLPDYGYWGLKMGNDEFRQLLADSVVEMPAKTWHPEPTHLEVAPYDAELEQIKALRDANWNPYRPMNAGDALEAGQGPDGTLID